MPWTPAWTIFDGSPREPAELLGFNGFQSLIRATIGEGLRKDLARLESSQFQALTESLRKCGIDDKIISAAIADAQRKTA